MSIASAIQTKQQQVAAAYTACNSKGATMPSQANQNLSNLATTIGTIPQDSPSPEPPSDGPYVAFLDYDGTEIQRLTLVEAHALTAMPSGPTHEGLVFDGWCVPLTDIQNTSVTIEVVPYFNTSDGKTRFYLSIPEGLNEYERSIHFRFYQSVTEGVTVDWGDGTAPYAQPKNGNSNEAHHFHTYAAAGDYVIALTCASGASWSPINENNPFFTDDWSRDLVKKIEFGNGISSINGLCEYLYKLETVTLPSYLASFTTIPNGTFRSCELLKCLPLSTEIVALGQDALSYTYALNRVLYLPKLTTLNNQACRLSGFKAISSLGLITTIPGNNVFQECSSLESVILPSALTTLGGAAFTGCRALKTVSLPTGLTTISNNVFQNCSALHIPSLPSNITSIGQQAFYYGPEIDDINLTSLTSIGSQAFLASKVKKVTSLGSATSNVNFSNCNLLESIVFPSGLTTLPGDAVRNAYRLRSVSLPSSLTTISNTSLYSNNIIEQIIIPASVTSIGQQVFGHWYGLKSVIMQPTTPPTLGSGCFGNDDLFVILVPSASFNDYKTTTNWSAFADRMRKTGVTYSLGDYIGNKVVFGDDSQIDAPGYFVTDYIPVTGGHVIKIGHAGYYVTVVQYDSSKNVITSNNVNNGYTVTLNASAAYIRFSDLVMHNNATRAYDNTDGALLYPFETV